MPRGDGTGPWWAQSDPSFSFFAGGQCRGSGARPGAPSGRGRRGPGRRAPTSTEPLVDPALMVDPAATVSLEERMARLEEKLDRVIASRDNSASDLLDRQPETAPEDTP